MIVVAMTVVVLGTDVTIVAMEMVQETITRTQLIFALIDEEITTSKHVHMARVTTVVLKT